MPDPNAILIAGPTASGKSVAAVALAEKLNGVVINADSMQVYRELHILTARPGAAEEARVPHMLYGCVSASEAYSVGKWLADVSGAVDAARISGKIPIITGGTGLYFKALLEGLSPVPDIPDDVRAYWREEAKKREGNELHAMLGARDPDMVGRLRPSDRQRIIRALEVIDATGRSLARWHEKPGEALIEGEKAVRIFIAPPRELLYARIDARFDAMIDEGALDEAAALAVLKLDPGLPVMRALGVVPLIAYLQDNMTLENAVARAKTDSRRYAKRQITWAKRNMIAWNIINSKDSESLLYNIFSIVDD